jgi:hypothetical protein
VKGTSTRNAASPDGTAEGSGWVSAVPSELVPLETRAPNVETLGYSRSSGQAGELKLWLGTGELKGEALVDLLHAGDFVVGFAGRHAVLGNPLGIDALPEGELAGSAID